MVFLRARFVFGFLVGSSLLPGVALGASLLATIPTAPHGDVTEYSTGHVIPLSPGALLVGTLGPDNTSRTADDVTLLIQDPGGPGQSVTPLATPYIWEYSWNTRLSATRVLLQGAGPDGARRTADDEILLLDGLGSTNTVTPITVGPIEQEDATAPVALSPDMAALATLGPDLASRSADDTVALLTDLGGTNTVTQLPAPFLETGCCLRAARHGPESFLIASGGPDGFYFSADDVLYFFHDLATAPTRTDIATPFLQEPSRAAVLSPTRAVIQSVGPDASDGTADDGVHLIDDLGGANTVTTIGVPSIFWGGASRPVAVGPDSALVTTGGADNLLGTADDSLVLLSDLGGTNTVTGIPVGPVAEHPASLATLLSPDIAVLSSFGPDLTYNSADDQLTVVSDLGGSNTVLFLGTGGSAEGVTSKVARLGSDSVAVATGGADGTLGSGSGDDDHLILSGIGGALVAEAIPAGGDFGNEWGYPYVMQPLGGGRAAYVGSGPDNFLATGGDDEVRVVEGTTDDLPLSVQKLKISANSKGEKLKVTVALPDEVIAAIGAADMTVGVGTLTQTIPASGFTAKKNSISYKDKTQVVQSVKVSLKKGTMTLKGKGTGTGLENTDPAYVPVFVELAGDYRADAVAGTATSNGVKYKAPK